MRGKKLVILLFFCALPILSHGQNVTIFYFGESSCNYCNDPNFIKSIKKLKAKFNVFHKELDTKFVMVSMDKNISKGLKFVKKYGNYWDEISIGSFYHNELALANLNKLATPGVPHILIYKVFYKNAGYGTKLIAKKKILKNLVGASSIIKWANSEMKLE